MATFEEFTALDKRIRTVLEAQELPKARVPAIKMNMDFGEKLGIKQSSAQITKRYTPKAMIGKQVVTIVNFPPCRVAGFKSEVLGIGGVPVEGDVILLMPNQKVPNGTKIHE